MDSLILQDIQPSRVGHALLRGWLLIFAVGVLGGMAGLAIDWVLPADYQASAALGIGVDPTLAAPFSGNVQYEANLRTQDLFLSDTTLETARETLPSELAGPTLDDFRSNIRLEHFEGEWFLRSTAGSPEEAAQRANAWASAAIEQFRAAQAHAVKAGEFQALLFSVACTPEVVVAQGGSNLWVCNEMHLNLDPSEVSTSLLAEARLSHGILPGLSISETQQAAPPVQPMVQTRALFVLGGTLIGLVLGVLAALRVWGQEGRMFGTQASS